MVVKLVTWSKTVGERAELVSTYTLDRRLVVACTEGMARITEWDDDPENLRGFRLLPGMSVEIRAPQEVYVRAEAGEAHVSVLEEYDDGEPDPYAEGAARA